MVFFMDKKNDFLFEQQQQQQHRENNMKIIHLFNVICMNFIKFFFSFL